MGSGAIHLLVALAFYLPLENFLLKWLPVSDFAYLLLRQIPDLLVGLVALHAWLRHCYRQGPRLPLIGGLADPAILAFIALAALAIAVNGASLAHSFANLKALLRYVLLVYVVLMLRPTEREARRFWLALAAGVVIQMLFGAAQWIGGIGVRDLLAAREVQEQVASFTLRFTGARFQGVNDLMGTQGNTINYALFLIVGLAAWTAERGRDVAAHTLGTLLLLLFIYLTGSRAALLTALLVVLMGQLFAHGHGRFMLFSAAAAILAADYLLASGLSSDPSNLTHIFTRDYLAMAMNQRLGIVALVLPGFLLSRSLWLGLGPDEEAVAGFVAASLPEVPRILLAVLPQVVEDVYWIALLFYYGLGGLLLFGAFYLAVAKRIGRLSREEGGLAGRYASLALLLLVAGVPLNLFNQAFEMRQFAFYLWMSVGLALALARNKEPSHSCTC